MEKSEEFYAKFKERLNDTTEFPSDFMYKFILPTSLKKMAELQQIFDGTCPNFLTRESKNGNYTSVTVTVFVLDADQVIHYYQKAAEIEGIILL